MRPALSIPVLALGSLPLRSRARRSSSDVLGLRLSLDAIEEVDGFLSMMSDVDDRRMLGGISMDRNGEFVCEREYSGCGFKSCDLSMLLRCELYGECGNRIKWSSSSSWPTVSTRTNGGFAMMLDLLDVMVAVLIELLLLSLFSLPCLSLMLEQNDLKLKSSDLKLMRLEWFLFDFFDGFDDGC